MKGKQNTHGERESCEMTARDGEQQVEEQQTCSRERAGSEPFQKNKKTRNPSPESKTLDSKDFQRIGVFNNVLGGAC